MGEMEEETGRAATLPLPGEPAPGLGSSPLSSPVQIPWFYGLKKQSPERGKDPALYSLQVRGLPGVQTQASGARRPRSELQFCGTSVGHPWATM